MQTSRTLEIIDENTTTVDISAENSTRQPKRALHWWRFSKLGLGLVFLAAAAYFFHEQVWTSTSLEGTVTSPLITIRSPIDGVVTANATTIGAPVLQHEALFVIEAHQLDTRLRAEPEAKLAAAQQQTLVIDRKIAELSTLRAQLQARTQVHREATLARIETLIAETTAELNRAKAVMERTQHELSRAKTLSANGPIAQTTLDDAVLAGQQARFEVERQTASLKRLTVERTAAKNGVLLGEGYGDAPYSQQQIDELATRVIEAKAERDSVQQTQQELASRLVEEQRREDKIRTYSVNAPLTGIVWKEKATLLVWLVYFTSIVTIAGLMCFEPWYRRREERFDLADEPASLLIRGHAIPVRIINLSITGARVRLPRPLVVPSDQAMRLQKRHVGLLPCTLADLSDTELAVAFLPIANTAVRQALVRALYTNPVVQGNRHATFEVWPMVKRLGRLLVAWP